MVLKNLFTGQEWKNRHRDRLMDMRRREERVRCIKRVTWKHITIGKIDNQQELTVWLRRWEGGLVGDLKLFLWQCPILGYIICLFEFSDLITFQFSPVQFSHSIMSDSCDPMHCNIPGLPVHHPLPELAQTYVHQVGDAIQPSHPLLSPSPPAFNLSQLQGLFKWVSSSHQVTK